MIQIGQIGFLNRNVNAERVHITHLVKIKLFVARQICQPLQIEDDRPDNALLEHFGALSHFDELIQIGKLRDRLQREHILPELSRYLFESFGDLRLLVVRIVIGIRV